jgi:prevent-host-death family protein
MRFASITEVRNNLSKYLSAARETGEAIVVTNHAQAHALIQPPADQNLDELQWRELARRRLAQSWADEHDALYDYL